MGNIRASLFNLRRIAAVLDAMAQRTAPMQSALARGQSWGGVILFFVFFGVFLWKAVDPTLQYHALSPIFLGGLQFLNETVHRPGDLMHVTASGILQFYQWGLAGALISTSLAALLCGLTFLSFKRMNLPPIRTLGLLPAIGLLTLQCQYAAPTVEHSLGLAIAAGCLVLYLYIPWQCPWIRTAIFLSLSVGLHLLAAGKFLIFLSGGVLFEALVRRRYWLAAGECISGLALPYGASLAFWWPFPQAVLGGLMGSGPTFSAAVFLGLNLFFPVGILVGGWAARRLAPTASDPAKKPAKAAAARSTTGGRMQLGRWLDHPAVGLILAIVPAIGSYDAEAQRLIRIDALASSQQWPALLEEARSMKIYSASTIADVDRALGHTSQLLYDLFSFPQRSDLDFWLDVHALHDNRIYLKASASLFELGQINKAEWLAAEALELFGPRPEVLQRLALVNILKGEPNAARVFLKLLERVPFQGAWARGLSGELATDPALASHEDLQSIRRSMLQQDYVGHYTPEGLLLQCLQRNPHNRMAFECLMAHYLLTQQLDKIQEHLFRLGSFHYPDVPRHLEEALLIREKLKGGNLVETAGGRINPRTLQRYQEFHERFMSYRGDIQAAQAGLARDFGDTYWFYYVSGVSGAARRAKEIL
jgi:hypothetical protein